MASSESTIIKRFVAAQNSLVLQSSDLSLETIAAMVENEAIDVSPQYQRRERWKPETQAKLIESFLGWSEKLSVKTISGNKFPLCKNCIDLFEKSLSF